MQTLTSSGPVQEAKTGGAMVLIQRTKQHLPNRQNPKINSTRTSIARSAACPLSSWMQVPRHAVYYGLDSEQFGMRVY